VNRASTQSQHQKEKELNLNKFQLFKQSEIRLATGLSPIRAAMAGARLWFWPCAKSKQQNERLFLRMLPTPHVSMSRSNVLCMQINCSGATNALDHLTSDAARQGDLSH
jgi:hypothetical protein